MTRTTQWIQRLGIISISIAFAYLWLFVHYLRPIPLHFFHDPEMAYFMDSLGVFKGKLYGFCQHPGTPVALIGSFLFALTYPFLTPTENFLIFHLRHPELFMSMARGILATSHVVGCLLLIKYAVRVEHWVDAFFAIAVGASFYVAAGFLGIRSVILWDHNSFNLPVGSLLLLGLLITISSEEPIRRWRYVALGFGAGVLTATQLYFMTWVIAVIVSVATLYLLRRHNWSQTVLECFYIGLASVIGFALITLPFTSLRCHEEFIAWVHSIVFHQGLYGSGEPGIISTAQIRANLLQLWADNAVLCIAIGLVMAMLLAMLFWQIRCNASKSSLWAVVLGLIVQLVATTLLILKHYNQVYLMALAAVLPLLLAIVHRMLGSSNSKLRLLYTLISITILAGFAHLFYKSIGIFQGMAYAVQSNTADVESFLNGYANAIGKSRQGLRIVWSPNRSIVAPCSARWSYSSFSYGVLAREIFRICPNDFYLAGPYVYWPRQLTPLNKFNWDIVVTTNDFISQWPNLTDNGFVAREGQWIFIGNWKRLDRVNPQLERSEIAGYNIFRMGPRLFFGVPQSKEGLNLERLQTGAYRNLAVGTTLDEVKDRISALFTQPAAGLHELAQNKAAVQSSTMGEGRADRAVDGITNGAWASGSVTHTVKESQPWWQVDLGSEHFVHTVRIWNRTDCCGERLTNFVVLVSDTPFNSTDLTNITSQPGIAAYRIVGPAKPVTDITVNRNERYVRVQLMGDDYLSLAEVQVWGK